MISRDAREAAYLINRLDRLRRAGDQPLLNPVQWEAIRYLARANRFSRTPAALADYLGSTRGTVSQTLIALEQKGYVARRPSERDGRSLALELTPSGVTASRNDPLLRLARDIDAATASRPAALREALHATLKAAIDRNEGRAFGACRTCVHFRRAQSGKWPYHCALLNEPLSESDSNAICAEQEPAPA